MYERTGTLVQKKFREYLFPTIMTSVAVSLASVVDSVIVGNLLGDRALAAVGLCSPVIYCLNTIYMLFGIGGITLAAIAKGKRQNDEADATFSTTIILGFLAQCLFVAVVFIFMTPLTTRLADGPGELQELTATYLRPLLLTGPAMMLSMGTALFIRTDSRPKLSASISLTANIVNLILDYCLIRFFNFGIAGAGLSTSLGYIIGILLILPYLLSPQRSFHFRSPSRDLFRRLGKIFTVGLPKALTSFTGLFRSIVLNALVMAHLGSLGMSAMTVCINLLMITNIFVGGTSDTLLPIVATLYGERDYFGIRAAVKSAYRILTCACLALALCFILWPATIAGWFGIDSPEALTILKPALRLFSLCLPFFGLNMLLQNFYNTTGREKLASFMATVDGFVYVCFYAALFVQLDANLIWLCYFAAEVTTLISALVIGRLIKRRENISGILLLTEDESTDLRWDLTIPADTQNALGVSAAAINFCTEAGVDPRSANRLGVAVEEMAVNVATYNQEKHRVFVDLLLRVTPEEVILRLRDNGVAFDPTTYQPEETQTLATSGIEVIKKLASYLEYDRQLGFNVAIIRIARHRL